MQTALVAVLLAVLVLLPALEASPSLGRDLVVLTLALALAGAVVSTWRGLRVARSASAGPGTGIRGLPELRGRATDPAHHPQAPRAPGQV